VGDDAPVGICSVIRDGSTVGVLRLDAGSTLVAVTGAVGMPPSFGPQATAIKTTAAAAARYILIGKE
jgi:hypothetical protein